MVVDIREYAVSEPDSHYAADADTLDLEDYDVPVGGDAVEVWTQCFLIINDLMAPQYIDLSTQADEPAGIVEAPAAEEADAPAVHVEAVHYERELEPGVPMPVAADPSVPDPTSVAPSPKDSGAVTPADADASTSRDSSVNGSISSRDRSPSGLFTPLTAENSRPPTPKLRSTDLGDAHYESPLKHVVTAEQLASADGVAGTPSAGIDDAPVPSENASDTLPSTHPLAESTVVPTEDLEDSQPNVVPVVATELDELNLEYPSDTEVPAAVSTEDNQQTGEHVVPSTNVHADSDTDVEPDHDSLRRVTAVAPEPTEGAEGVITAKPTVEVPVNGEAVAKSAAINGVEDASDIASDELENGVSLNEGPEQDTQAKLNGAATYVKSLPH